MAILRRLIEFTNTRIITQQEIIMKRILTMLLALGLFGGTIIAQEKTVEKKEPAKSEVKKEAMEGCEDMDCCKDGGKKMKKETKKEVKKEIKKEETKK